MFFVLVFVVDDIILVPRFFDDPFLSFTCNGWSSDLVGVVAAATADATTSAVVAVAVVAVLVLLRNLGLLSLC